MGYRLAFFFALAALVLPAAASAAPTTLQVGQQHTPLERNLVAVTPGERLRLTASGSLRYDLASPDCVSVSPRGCASDTGSARPHALAPAGALIGTFVDQRGTAISPPFFVGEAALVVAPPQAAALWLRPNLAATARAGGSFSVSTASLGIGAASLRPETARIVQSVRSPRSSIGTLPGQRALPVLQDWTRLATQHLLRRLGFSGSPEYVTAMLAQGPTAWLNQQLTPSAIDDSAALATIEAKPTTSDANGQLLDRDVYERRLIQRQVATARQVQEKLVLHWLDHFSVGNAKVNDAAMMSHYEDTLRADALGNFKQLMIDVTKEPAMLYWLDNNRNVGSNPVTSPPNENYSRESMQLYVMGTSKLKTDGSLILDATGTEVANYSQQDVQTLAALLSGFSVAVQYTAGSDPNARFSVAFSPTAHGASKSVTLLGKTLADPGDQTCVNVAMDSLVRNPSTAPFNAKELIERIATEKPSPGYVAAIARVWSANVDAPDQIAQVVKAIVTYPEFVSSYRSMPKEPAELNVQAVRQLPGVLKAATSGTSIIGPGEDFAGAGGFNGSELQQLYNPSSVFSFYPPGAKNAIVSQQSILQRFDSLADVIAADPTLPGTNTGIDIAALRARIGSTDPATTATYLLDALVDGQADTLRTSVLTYLGTAAVDDVHLRGALWVIMTSPEYEVN